LNKFEEQAILARRWCCWLFKPIITTCYAALCCPLHLSVCPPYLYPVLYIYTLKNDAFFPTHIWVKMDKLKCWVKNAIKKKLQLKILNDIFNPTFGFVHIW